jgi:hypothetical protein
MGDLVITGVLIVIVGGVVMMIILDNGAMLHQHIVTVFWAWLVIGSVALAVSWWYFHETTSMVGGLAVIAAIGVVFSLVGRWRNSRR